MNFFAIVFYILTGSCILYVLIITYLSYGWYSLGEYNRNFSRPSTLVSILIPARNEELNILNCLTDVARQDYPSELFEIIVIDDVSQDKTVSIVKKFIDEHPEKNIRLLILKEEEKNVFKKRAITHGVKQAKGTLIVTTDADCTMNEKWLSTIVNYYETYGVSMIAGPVCMNEKKSLFQKLQSLEFLSLIVSGAASITLNRPILCNGANLAYEKSSFEFANGFKENEKYASGDDIFLMHKLIKRKERIGFIRNTDAIVYTQANNNLKSFVSQRVRWISKTRSCKDFFTILTAVIVYFFNTILLAGLITGIFFPIFYKIFLIFFVVKLFIDLPLIGGITFFMGRFQLMLFYLPMQIINIIYVPVVGLLGNFSTYSWKGRKIKRFGRK